MLLRDGAVCGATVESSYPLRYTVSQLRYTYSKGAADPLLRGTSVKATWPWSPTEHVERLIDDATDVDATASLEDMVAGAGVIAEALRALDGA